MARILVCDDDLRFAGALRAVLSDYHHEVHIFETGDELLSALEHTPCDVVIIDVVMPGGGAISVVPKVKEITPETKVIVCTGRSIVFSSPVMTHGMQAADAKIEKVIAPHDLNALIERLLTPEGG